MQVSATLTGGRPNGETRAAPALHVIDNLAGNIRSNLLLDDKIEPANLLDLLYLFWLIQSQPQTGSASAKTFKDHPQTFSRVLAQKHLQLLFRLIGNLH